MYKVIEDPEHHYRRVDPIPSVEEVEKYYKEDFYAETNPAFNDSSLEVQQRDKMFFDARWERIHEVCEKYIGSTKGRKAYDIGFGYAQALLYLKEKGLICGGIEPSQEGVDYAKQHGINGKVAGIEEPESYISEEKQDIVLLINVLEHLRTPYETLTNIREHLIADNGILVIDVPNEFNAFQMAANTQYDLKDWWVAPPKHINYFSLSSLVTLLNKAKFEVIYEEASFPMELFLLFGDVFVGNQSLGRLCHEKRMNFEFVMRRNGFADKLNKFYESLAQLELGRQITVFAKPIA
jgi:2-polyprenyl-3-methyl-5-hydroxy-6-metoxy-1,4-benzoquinol methylase